MSKINDGGPAFPLPLSSEGAPVVLHQPPEICDGAVGMTLRDYLAAKAMQGMMASLPASTLTELIKDRKMGRGVAGAAYDLADLMLSVRTMEMRQPEPAFTE